MKCYAKIVVMLASLFVPFSALAEENTLKKAVWVEGGSTVKGNYSVAVGTRLGPVGVKFGYGGDWDYEGKNVMDAHPFSPAELGVTASSLGQKRIDPAFGFDFGYFYDVTKNSLHMAKSAPTSRKSGRFSL